MKLISFEQAIEQANVYNNKHLLLGNGFSIACIPTIFSYNSLFEQADFSKMPEIQKVFKQLETTDFEIVIDALEKSSKTIQAYSASSAKVTAKMLEHAAKLKELLIETIAKNHPPHPSSIEDYKYEACNDFLKHFIDAGGRVYSLNYDLLLYWSLMYGMNNGLIEALPNDGFGRDVEIDGADINVSPYVTWQGETNAHQQNVHYLHGALHVFDRGVDIEKFTWTDTGIKLIEQIRKALEDNRFPLFVAESENKKKMERIIHSGYLYHSYKSFSSAMAHGTKKSKSCLFTFGVSFSENDQHIMRKISTGKVAEIFVGIYGKPDSAVNKNIIQSVGQIVRKRSSGSLKVTFYNSETAKVWG